jgi:hypothetical protein
MEMGCVGNITIEVEVPVVVVDRVIDIITVETTSQGIGTERGWGMQGVGINASILHQRRIAKTVVANYRSHWVHHYSQHIYRHHHQGVASSIVMILVMNKQHFHLDSVAQRQQLPLLVLLLLKREGWNH